MGGVPHWEGHGMGGWRRTRIISSSLQARLAARLPLIFLALFEKRSSDRLISMTSEFFKKTVSPSFSRFITRDQSSLITTDWKSSIMRKKIDLLVSPANLTISLASPILFNELNQQLLCESDFNHIFLGCLSVSKKKQDASFFSSAIAGYLLPCHAAQFFPPFFDSRQCRRNNRGSTRQPPRREMKFQNVIVAI